MKVKRIQELAMDAGVPLIGLNDSGGGRIQEGLPLPMGPSSSTT